MWDHLCLNLANTQIIDTLPNAKVNSLNLFNAENGTVYAYVNHGDGYLYGYKIIRLKFLK